MECQEIGKTTLGNMETGRVLEESTPRHTAGGEGEGHKNSTTHPHSSYLANRSLFLGSNRENFLSKVNLRGEEGGRPSISIPIIYTTACMTP